MKTDYKFGIIGAGLAGIALALRLVKSSTDTFQIFERANEAGGVWRENIYPGCNCDIPSALYSFAAEPNPDWSSVYASQSEIYQYINDVIDKNGIRKHIRFSTEITDATFDSINGTWNLTDNLSGTTCVKILIVAMGNLNRPKIPEFEGIAGFKGKIFHSAQWERDYPLEGKKVGVIGTGASAVQLVPALAGKVSQLSVFQRTPIWVAARNNLKISLRVRAVHRSYPLVTKALRSFYYWKAEILGRLIMGPKPIRTLIRNIFIKKLQKEIHHPDTRKKLLPTDTIGCRSPTRSDDYYPTFNRSNVDLVVDPIECFLKNGIRTANGKEHELDIVVMATGFETAGLNFPLNINGLNGQNLREVWKQTDCATYKGMITTGFPNMCFMAGPNSIAGLNSSLLVMEDQSEFILKYSKEIDANCKFLDVKAEAQKRYMDFIKKKFTGSIWQSGCRSWQQNAAGKNIFVFPGTHLKLKRQMKQFTNADFDITYTAEKLNKTYLIDNIIGWYK